MSSYLHVCVSSAVYCLSNSKKDEGTPISFDSARVSPLPQLRLDSSSRVLRTLVPIVQTVTESMNYRWAQVISWSARSTVVSNRCLDKLASVISRNPTGRIHKLDFIIRVETGCTST